MYLILKWILFALALIFTAYIIPGISVANFTSALIVVIIMALINIIVKPILTFVTLPINILTLGIFTFIVNALLFMLAGYLAPGFQVDGFLRALIGSLIMSVLGSIINSIDKSK